MIEIYWQDLTPEKQQEIMDKLGENGNWDVFPIVQIPESDEEAGGTDFSYGLNIEV